MSNNCPARTLDVPRQPADIGGARGQHAGFDAVSAARAELDYGSPGRRFGDASRLGGDHRLETDRCEQRGFHESALRRWAR